jgi:hypothetical protein
MEGAEVVVVEATVNMVNRWGWNISLGRIIRRLVLRACDYYYIIISSSSLIIIKN